LSPELSREIVRVRQYGLDEFAGYQIPFLATYFGHAMRHGGHPHFHLRLFNRRRTAFGGEEIHERVIAYGPVGRLRGNIVHDSYRDLDHQLVKVGRYARLMADSMRERGTSTGALRMVLDPAWRFLRAYILRRGYLDGWRGFAVAQIEANQVWEKYLRLYIAERAPDARPDGKAQPE
jgi:hypothetical protein